MIFVVQIHYSPSLNYYLLQQGSDVNQEDRYFPDKPRDFPCLMASMKKKYIKIEIFYENRHNMVVFVCACIDK
jgi:hypothetical protein